MESRRSTDGRRVRSKPGPQVSFKEMANLLCDGEASPRLSARTGAFSPFLSDRAIPRSFGDVRGRSTLRLTWRFALQRVQILCACEACEDTGFYRWGRG